MQQKYGIFAAKCAVFLAVPAVIYSFSGGPPPVHTGAPGEPSCTECHSGVVNSGSGQLSIELSSGTLTYTPGVKQTITVRLTGDNTARFGFELAAKLANGGQAGSLAPAPGESGMQVICADGSPRSGAACPAGAPVQYIEHSNPRTTPSFQVEWTPPATDQGPVSISAAFNAANGNFSNTGDHIYTKLITVAPAAAQNTPAINANGVVNGASFQAGITPGAWASIFGTNFSSTTRTWDGAIGADGTLPTTLENVSVTIDGKPAAISLVSPSQLNVQVPGDVGVGSAVQVRVTTPQGSAESSVIASAAQPACFKFGTTSFIAATHANNNPIGPAGAFDNPNTAPASAGETIQIWCTGFGATNPATPTGRVVNTANQIDRSQLRVTIAGQDAQVQFAGITLAGVWQINVTVPGGLPAGPQPVAVTMAGQTAPGDLLLALQPSAPASSNEPPGY